MDWDQGGINGSFWQASSRYSLSCFRTKSKPGWFRYIYLFPHTCSNILARKSSLGVFSEGLVMVHLVRKTIYLYSVVSFEVTNSTKKKVIEEFKVCKRFVLKAWARTHSHTHTHLSFTICHLSLVSPASSPVSKVVYHPWLSKKERYFLKQKKTKKEKSSCNMQTSAICGLREHLFTLVSSQVPASPLFLFLC